MKQLAAEERAWRDAIANFCAKLAGTNADEARLRLFCDDVREDVYPSREDLKYLAAAVGRMLAGDEPKKAFGIAGVQHQGRHARTLQEKRVRWHVAYRVIGLARSMGKEQAIDKVTSELLLCAPTPTDDDPVEAYERMRRYVESCYRELSEEERESIRAEQLEDDYIAARHKDDDAASPEMAQ